MRQGAAVHEVVDSIIADIKSGKLKLHTNKIVVVVPDKIAFKKPDVYGYVKRATANKTQAVNSVAGKTFVVLNIFEHLKAIIFMLTHPNSHMDAEGNIHDYDSGAVYDENLRFIGYEIFD